MGKKKKHYSLDRLLSCEAQYNILYGERSNGKSYAVKKRCLERAYKNGEKFVYLRRWLEDLAKNRAESYWDDMEENDDGLREIENMTGGEYTCVSVYRGEIFFATRDETGKKKRGMQIGRALVLTGDTHEKSRVFVGYYRILFEEVITKSGYLGDEVNIFKSVVSTVLRRRDGEVFLIGNSLTKQCPYFREWQLVNVPNQKIGTIDIYYVKTGENDDEGNPIKIKIACEYCENTAGITKMIFGNKMITTGEWESEELEHLPHLYNEYKRIMSVLVDDDLEKFVIDLMTWERQPFLYVRLYVKKWTDYEKFDIIISDKFNHNSKYIKKLSAYPSISKVFRKLFESGKVCYEDNLIGTSFITLLKNRSIF